MYLPLDFFIRIGLANHSGYATSLINLTFTNLSTSALMASYFSNPNTLFFCLINVGVGNTFSLYVITPGLIPGISMDFHAKLFEWLHIKAMIVFFWFGVRSAFMLNIFLVWSSANGKHSNVSIGFVLYFLLLSLTSMTTRCTSSSYLVLVIIAKYTAQDSSCLPL